MNPWWCVVLGLTAAVVVVVLTVGLVLVAGWSAVRAGALEPDDEPIGDD